MLGSLFDMLCGYSLMGNVIIVLCLDVHEVLTPTEEARNIQ